MTIGVEPVLDAVDSSMPVIWNAPSPTSTTGRERRVGEPRAHAAGTAKPIEV